MYEQINKKKLFIKIISILESIITGYNLVGRGCSIMGIKSILFTLNNELTLNIARISLKNRPQRIY